MPEDNTIKLEPSWKRELETEFAKPYMQALRTFLKDQYGAGKKIYPHANEYFSAFNLTPFEGVKVVVIGQDPYHGAGQAHGLCFSVRPGVRPPPSLQNIYKEIHRDLGFAPPNHGCLVSWARQGVLLLNATLTVEHGKAGSHQGRGWEEFTDRVIALLNEKRQHLVFVLWGSFAQKKGALIDRKRHLVLESPHPSPFSAHRGFLGNRHFSLINRYLSEHGIEPIHWELPANPQMPS